MSGPLGSSASPRPTTAAPPTVDPRRSMLSIEHTAAPRDPGTLHRNHTTSHAVAYAFGTHIAAKTEGVIALRRDDAFRPSSIVVEDAIATYAGFFHLACAMLALKRFLK